MLFALALAGLLLLAAPGCRTSDEAGESPAPDPAPAAPAPGSSGSAAELRDVLDRVLELHHSGKHLQALDLATSALETWPAAAGLHHEVGVLRALTGDVEGAVAPLERAVELAPEAARSWRALGRYQARTGANASAVESYARCVDLEPDHRDCRLGLGRALIAEDRLPEAEEHLEAVASEGGVEGWADLARLRVREGRLEEAVDAWSRALAADRHHVPTLLGYGQTLVRLGRREEGQGLLSLHREAATLADRIDALERQVAGGEAHREVHLALAEAHLLREDRDRAEAVWEEALRQHPDLLDAEAALIGSRIESGRIDDAERALAALGDRVPGHPAVELLTGLVAIARGEADRAKAAFETSRRLSPWGAGQWVGVGVAWLEADRPEEAVRALTAALERDPRNSGALRGLAEALRRTGRPREAMDAARRALEVEPADPELWLTIGLLQEEQGMEEEARRSFTNAIDLQAFDLLAADGPERLEERLEEHRPRTSARALWRRVLGERIPDSGSAREP